MEFTRQAEGLTWGAFALHGPETDANGQFDVRVDGEGTSFSDPEAIIESVAAALRVGQAVSIAGWEARRFPLMFTLAAADGEALAVAERELERQSNALVPPPLVWTPPLGLSAPVAFDVQVVEKRRVYDGDFRWDFREASHGERAFELTFTCRPFVRAVEKVVIPALPPPLPGSTPTLVTDCATTSGWTVEGESAVLTTGSAATPDEDPDTYVQVQNSEPFVIGDELALLWSGSAVVDGEKWLGIRAQKAGGWTLGDVGINGQIVHPDAGDSWTSWYPLPSTMTHLESVEIAYSHPSMGATPIPASETWIRVFDLSLSDSLPANGTGRQLSRLSEVRGGRETEATIRLWDETPATLGKAVVVHTSRNLEWAPMLRPWEVSGEVTSANSGLVSGRYSVLGPAAAPFVARIPAQLLTQGMYVLMANVSLSSAMSGPSTLAWSVTVVDDEGVSSPWAAEQSGEAPVAAPEFEIVGTSDDLHLPPSLTSGEGWFVEVTLSVPDGAPDVLFDEGWLFGLDDGCLTWWPDESGSAEWIEVRSPDVGGLYPSIWAGTNIADLSAGMEVSRLAKSAQPHRFRPGPIRVTTVCLGSTSSRCELEYYPRGDHHIVGADLQDPETP